MKSEPRYWFGGERASNPGAEVSKITAIRHLPVVNQILTSVFAVASLPLRRINLEFCCLTLILLAPNILLAQPIPDTLNWHRYYPLTVGNVWEYQVVEGEPLLRRVIIGDTVVLGREYFLMDETAYDYDYLGGGTELEVFFRDTFYVRYDTLGTVVALKDVNSDTSSVPRSELSYAAPDVYFDLRSAFGDSVRYGERAEDFYLVGGGYDRLVETGFGGAYVAAHKVFQDPLWMESYATELGFLGGGNLWGPRITFAKISGAEYGVSRKPSDDTGVVKDALDWHGYFPLELGNTWQIYYQNLPFVMPETKWYVTLTVAGDTVLEGREYHKLDSICVTTAYFDVPGLTRDPCEGAERTFEFFRYDEETSNIVEYIPTENPRERLRFGYDFRLDAAFGSYVESMYGAYEYFMSDWALVDTDTVAATVKHVSVYSAIPTGYSFAHGIGYLGTGGCEGDCWEYKLVYAKIGEKTYGEYRPVANENVARLPTQAKLVVYPNPVASKTRIDYTAPKVGRGRVVVYDALGRERMLYDLGQVAPRIGHRQIDTHHLSSGMYLISLEIDGVKVAQSKMVVVR